VLPHVNPDMRLASPETPIPTHTLFIAAALSPRCSLALGISNGGDSGNSAPRAPTGVGRKSPAQARKKG